MSYTNKQLAEQFISGTENARNSNGTMLIEDSVLYSYGKHYVAAIHHNGGVIINNTPSSATTERHKALIRGSTPKGFYLPCNDLKHDSGVDEILSTVKQEFNEYIEMFNRARKRKKTIINQMVRLDINFANFISFNRHYRYVYESDALLLHMNKIIVTCKNEANKQVANQT